MSSFLTTNPEGHSACASAVFFNAWASLLKDMGLQALTV